MPDKVALKVEGKRIENFTAYTIESDIYVADNAFLLELANPEVAVKEGARCELDVNDSLELTGTVERISKSYDKSGIKLKVEGRDLMGLLVDSYCEDFVTLENVRLKELAEKLLTKVPFINRKNIIYQQDVPDKKIVHKGEIPHNFKQIEPGQTIFEVLKQAALDRGLMFFSLPDGTFVFGKPQEKGEPKYRLVCTKSGGENNILEGSLTKDISKRYSKIVIVGQQQGLNDLAVEKINIQATVEDPSFPFYKPCVGALNSDEKSPELYAKTLMEQQQQQGFQLQYKVVGHSQNGKNYETNVMCQVKDEVFGINDTYLIYGRTFTLSKDGAFTTLKLGYPGVVL